MDNICYIRFYVYIHTVFLCDIVSITIMMLAMDLAFGMIKIRFRVLAMVIVKASQGKSIYQFVGNSKGSAAVGWLPLISPFHCFHSWLLHGHVLVSSLFAWSLKQQRVFLLYVSIFWYVQKLPFRTEKQIQYVSIKIYLYTSDSLTRWVCKCSFVLALTIVTDWKTDSLLVTLSLCFSNNFRNSICQIDYG